jgi:hypothetical protein
LRFIVQPCDDSFFIFPSHGAPVEWNWQGKTQVLPGKTCPSSSLSTTNPTWPDRGSKTGFRGGRPATNRLSHGTLVLQDGWWYLAATTTHNRTQEALPTSAKACCCLLLELCTTQQATSSAAVCTTPQSSINQCMALVKSRVQNLTQTEIRRVSHFP